MPTKHAATVQPFLSGRELQQQITNIVSIRVIIEKFTETLNTDVQSTSTAKIAAHFTDTDLCREFHFKMSDKRKIYLPLKH